MSDDFDNLPDGANIIYWGPPGCGKTGAVSGLLNAGFRVLFIDMENNVLPLTQYTDKDKLKFLRIRKIKRGMKPRFNRGVLSVKGEPKGFERFFNTMDEENIYDLGPDTVVVIDSVTRLNESIIDYVKTQANKHIGAADNAQGALSQPEWGAAQANALMVYDALKAPERKCHLIVLAHSRDEKNAGDRIVKQIPSGVGAKGSERLEGEFEVAILGAKTGKGEEVERRIRLKPTELSNAKFPVSGSYPTDLPLKDGLPKIFKYLGIDPPENPEPGGTSEGPDISDGAKAEEPVEKGKGKGNDGKDGKGYT